MAEFYFLKVFNVLVGIVGLAIALGVLLVPKAVLHVEKKLDKNFSTEKLEKILNERKNLSAILMKRPKFFGAILLAISVLLLLSNLLFFKL